MPEPLSPLDPAVDPRPKLRALDPAAWGTGLSDAGARAAWSQAIDGLTEPFLAFRPAGPPPRRVLIVASANVFTAPLPWLAWLSVQGVPVRLKPARGQLVGAEAIAAVLPGVEVRSWRGGDVDAEAEAVSDVDAMLVYGRAETLAAVRARLPAGVPMLGFGPRFGLAVGDVAPAAIAEDLAMYDSRGCMSPAAVLLGRSAPPTLDDYAAAMAEAESRWPRGQLDPDEGPALRARISLARALGGGVRTGPGWAVVELPLDRLSPVALPRCLVLHRCPDRAVRTSLIRGLIAPVGDTLAPSLGTLATHDPTLVTELGLPADTHQLRLTVPGQMQRPVASAWHDGYDVVRTLWPDTPRRPR